MYRDWNILFKIAEFIERQSQSNFCNKEQLMSLNVHNNPDMIEFHIRLLADNELIYGECRLDEENVTLKTPNLLILTSKGYDFVQMMKTHWEPISLLGTTDLPFVTLWETLVQYSQKTVIKRNIG